MYFYFRVSIHTVYMNFYFRFPSGYFLYHFTKTQYLRLSSRCSSQVVEGIKGQSIASDIFSSAKIAETIFEKAELGSLPTW